MSRLRRLTPAEHEAAKRWRPPPPVEPIDVDDLLSRLEAVRRNGDGRWMARCPAHGDRTGSLSIRVGDDGKFLLHCFAGCDFAKIVAALGIEPQQLFPPRQGPWRPRPPRPDPLTAARAEFEQLIRMHRPPLPGQTRAELRLIGHLVLDGPAGFGELPEGFKAARIRTVPLRIIFLAMAELVQQGTPRRWLSPLAIARELDRVEPGLGKQYEVHFWCRVAVQMARGDRR